MRFPVFTNHTASSKYHVGEHLCLFILREMWVFCFCHLCRFSLCVCFDLRFSEEAHILDATCCFPACIRPSMHLKDSMEYEWELGNAKNFYYPDAKTCMNFHACLGWWTNIVICCFDSIFMWTTIFLFVCLKIILAILFNIIEVNKDFGCEDPQWQKKHHKSGPYGLCIIFQVF